MIIGEANGGPTVTAIGNAVAHARGAGLRDLMLAIRTDGLDL